MRRKYRIDYLEEQAIYYQSQQKMTKEETLGALIALHGATYEQAVEAVACTRGEWNDFE